jgi:glycosyltransferase involved in cell wall biosynthesis
MRVLHIISSMDPKNGGVAEAVRNIINNNAYSDNEVVCFDDKSVDYGMSDNFIIHKIGKGKTSFQFHPGYNKWLEKNITDYNVIIVHGIWQYHNFCTYKVIKNSNKKNRPLFIVMPHGMLDPYFQKDSTRRLKAIRNEIVWRLTEKRAMNFADGLFFTCDEELLLARTTFSGYLPQREIVVGLGVQKPPVFNQNMEDDFKKVVPNLKNAYLLFLSRIHPKKGVDLLIEAYNEVCIIKKEIPDLVIAGPTDSEYAKQMILKAASNPKIHFSGMLTGNAKWGAFHGCEFYVLPSHQENFGIAIVEALACKKPVIITKNINIWREIEKGKAGWVLNELNVESIAEALFKITEITVIELQELGNHAKRTFDNEFDIESQCQFFVCALKKIIKI